MSYQSSFMSTGFNLRSGAVAADAIADAVYTPMPVATMRTLVVCRGPIAHETVQMVLAKGWELPHVIISANEWSAISAKTAPWVVALPPSHIHRVKEYNSVDEIMDIARRTNCQAVYPGYGFLAENADFAQRCLDQNLRWVGPLPQALRQVGDKDAAIRLAKELEIPTIPGDDALVIYAQGHNRAEIISESVHRAVEFSKCSPGRSIRFKHPAGGGGKGQAVFTADMLAGAHVEHDIKEGLMRIWSEMGVTAPEFDAKKGVVIELELVTPRHLEMQILGDGRAVVHFEGRDCSVQNRRYQKMVEISLHLKNLQDAIDRETHAGRLAQLRFQHGVVEKTLAAAVRIGEAIALRGAATVEFLVDATGEFYFLEVNPRIQVEHGVTEGIIRVHGQPVSIAELQIRQAAGERFQFTQADITAEGHTIELRLNAWLEDLNPALGGVIDGLRVPEKDGLRVDASGLLERDTPWEIPSYDANFALIIQQSPNRTAAIDQLLETLRSMTLRGNAQLRTNAAVLTGMLTLMKYLPDHTEFRTNFADAWSRAAACFMLQLSDLKAALPAEPAKGAHVGNPATHPYFFVRLQRLITDRLCADPSLALAFHIEMSARDQSRQFDMQYLMALAGYLGIPLDGDEQALFGYFADVYAAAALAEDQSTSGITQHLIAGLGAVHSGIAIESAQMITLDLPWVQELRQRLDRTQAQEFLRVTDDLSLHIPTYLRDKDIVSDLDLVLASYLRPSELKGNTLYASGSFVVYHRPGPDQDVYVREGSGVNKGDIVLLTEAMKMFGPLRSPAKGVIKRILVADGKQVKEGDPLVEFAVEEVVSVDQAEIARRIEALQNNGNSG